MARKSKYGNMPERVRYRAKVKGDAGVYQVFGIDWLNGKVLLDRAGYEWLPISKVALEQCDEVADCKGLSQAQREAFWEMEALTGLSPCNIGDIDVLGTKPIDVWNANIEIIEGICADVSNINFPE